jgi:transposase
MSRDAEKKFAVKWGKDVQGFGFTQLPNLLLDNYCHMGITALEAMFIIHLLEYMFTLKSPYPSYKTIGKKMGKSRNTIQYYARSLENKGWIVRRKRIGRQNAISLDRIIEFFKFAIPYLNSNKGGIKKAVGLYQNLNTKEDQLKRRKGKRSSDNHISSAISNLKDKYIKKL